MLRYVCHTWQLLLLGTAVAVSPFSLANATPDDMLHCGALTLPAAEDDELLYSSSFEIQQRRPKDFYSTDGNPDRQLFISTEGLPLQSYEWSVGAPRGVVVLVPGFRSHARVSFLHKSPTPDNDFCRLEYDGSLICGLNAAGFNVVAYDHRGTGLSAGRPRYEVPDIDRLARDLQSVLSDLRRRHSTLPISVVGLSMGGCVVTRALQMHEGDAPLADSTVLLAPMFLTVAENTYAPMVAKFASTPPETQLPDLTATMPDDAYSTRDEFRATGHFTVGTLMELVRAGGKARTSAAEVDTSKTKSLTIVHNAADNTCDIRGTLDFIRDVGLPTTFWVPNAAQVEGLAEQCDTLGAKQINGLEVDHCMINSKDGQKVKDIIIQALSEAHPRKTETDC